jgi:pyrimidine operon attenuation protein/uracil phosphoribosyltransferase
MIMTIDLTTTNVLLGIMAAVSLLEAAAVVGALFGGFLVFRRLMKVIADIEERQVAPAATRVTAILDDIKDVTSTIRQETTRVDGIIGSIVDTVGRCRQHATEHPRSKAS